ncbi:hypothetical protein pipiens_006008 [Culex pipiens pipiens]|uniref:F-box domain-containing protein n=1 Tax=Culex pipiens pipiens TaxID=38569 RepID=A0ABD1DSA4_CULPP
MVSSVDEDEPQPLELLDLPNEVQLHVLDHLDFRSRLAASRVCRLWDSLAFSGRFMDRVRLYLKLQPENVSRVTSVLNRSNRRYRHVVVNFENCAFPVMDQLVEMFGGDEALESLVLMGLGEIEAVQLVTILGSTPNLVRLFLLNDELDSFSKDRLLELPKCRVASATGHSSWLGGFERDMEIALPRLRNMCIVDRCLSFTEMASSIPRFFPGLSQLQITSNHASLSSVYQTLRSQLEKIVILSPEIDFFNRFADIGFPRLRYLYFDRMDLNLPQLIQKGAAFFSNPDHCHNLRQLVLHPQFMLRTEILTAICANCRNLIDLELSLDYLDGDALKDITNLTNLKNLTLYGTAYFQDTPHWPHQMTALSSVKIATCRFPVSLLEFIADIAPNLVQLALENIESPEEMFRLLPELLPNIRTLEMGYTKGFERPPSCHPSGYLRTMVALETVSLRRVIIRHGIQGWLQDAPRLKRVELGDLGTLSNTHLVILTTNCPKLRELKLAGCGELTREGIEEFRTRVPLCRVDWDGF